MFNSIVISIQKEFYSPPIYAHTIHEPAFWIRMFLEFHAIEPATDEGSQNHK